MKATAKDLRFHSKELIDSVSRGEEVVITFRGKPCAKLVPYQELKTKQKKMKCSECGKIMTLLIMLMSTLEILEKGDSKCSSIRMSSFGI